MDLLHAKYKIYCNFDLSVNTCTLNYLYLPIIEANAYILYNWLASEVHLQRIFFKISSNHERILLSLGIDEEAFTKARNNLEAMDLLVTRVLKEADGSQTYIYELVPPLTFDQFVGNSKYKNLLIRRISLAEYERISLVFKHCSESCQGSNISSTFEMVYNQAQEKPAFINIEQLQQNLSKKLGFKAIIGQEIVAIMQTFHRVYNLTIVEMSHVLSECSSFNDSTSIFFDATKLRKKLAAIVENTNNKTESIIELKRSIQIFDDSLSELEKNEIINDYLTLNCERYLGSLQRSEVTVDQQKLLNDLKKKQKLPDSIINLLLDYSVYHTYGRINENYLKKLARSINLLNLKTVYDVLHYLQQITLGNKHIDFYPTSVAS